jgi:hypothetical protein
VVEKILAELTRLTRRSPGNGARARPVHVVLSDRVVPARITNVAAADSGGPSVIPSGASPATKISIFQRLIQTDNTDANPRNNDDDRLSADVYVLPADRAQVGL